MKEYININSDVFIKDEILYISDKTIGHHNMIPLSNVKYVTLCLIDDINYIVVTFDDEFLLNIGISKHLGFKYERYLLDELIDGITKKQRRE